METNSISRLRVLEENVRLQCNGFFFFPGTPPSNKVTKVTKVTLCGPLKNEACFNQHRPCCTFTAEHKGIAWKLDWKGRRHKWEHDGESVFLKKDEGRNKHASNYCHIKVKHHIKSYGSLFSHRLSSDVPFKDMNSSFNGKCNEFLWECLTTPDILVCRGNNKLPRVSEREGEQIFVPSFIFVL